MNRVVFFDAYPHVYGGSARVITMLAEGLEARGWMTDVLLPGEGAVGERLRAEHVAVSVVSAPTALNRYGHRTTGLRRAFAAASLPLYWFRIWRALGKPKGVMHTNHVRGMLLAGLPARLAGWPVVWHLHSVDGSPLLRRLLHLLAARTVLVSSDVLRGAPELVGRRGVVTIANGTSSEPAASRRGSTPVVLCVARLHPDKGIDVLLKATQLLMPRLANVSVKVVGPVQEGYEHVAHELSRLAHDLGVEGNVEFLGPMADPFACPSAYAYVQPSRRETFGLAALEAMARGLPVVLTRAGGLRDLIDDGITGLAVDVEDTGALADSLHRLWIDEALASNLGAAGRARARARFSVDATVDAFERLYLSL